MILTAQKLREVLSYDPDTGVWTWLRSLSSTAVKGSVAGTVSVYGYRIITYQGVKYRSGRLAWLYMTDEWPTSEIDHDNRDKLDDRWNNLYDVSRSANALNRDLQSNNFSGARGVHYNTEKGLWCSQVKRNGINHFVGYFNDFDEAVAAQEEMALKLSSFTDPFCQANLYDIRGSVAMEMHT